MSEGVLIFCERTGAWAAAMRPLLADDALPMRETRSMSECQEELARYPASLVVVELDAASPDKTLAWLAGLSSRFPAVRCVGVACRELDSYQWVARELGCLAFCTSPRQLQPVADLVRSYFAALPRPEMTYEAEVWSRLPWKSTTTTA